MKTLMLLTALVTAGMSRGADIDHLVPVDTHFQKYRLLLASKIGTSPFNCGRVIITPAFEGESSLSVQCERFSGGQPKCYATYVSANDNLWQRTNGVQKQEKARLIGTKRIDAEMSETTAELIKQVWLRMLGQVQVHDNKKDKWRAVPIDGTGFEFSISHPRLSGELDLFAPDRGSKLTELMSISQELVDYCNAKPGKRRALADRIEREARHLLNTKSGQRF
jgi:hypothetical protein